MVRLKLETYSLFVFLFVLAGEFVVDIRLPVVCVQLYSLFLPY